MPLYKINLDGTTGHIFNPIAGVDEWIERIIRSAQVDPWPVVNTNKVLPAIVRRAEESNRRDQSLGLRWASKAKEGFRVAVLHQIGPIALVGGTVEG